MQRRHYLASLLILTASSISSWQPTADGQDRSILVARDGIALRLPSANDHWEMSAPLELAAETHTRKAGLAELVDETIPPPPGATFDASPIGTGVRDNASSMPRRRHVGDRPNARPDLLDPQRARPLPMSDSVASTESPSYSTTESVSMTSPSDELTPSDEAPSTDEATSSIEVTSSDEAAPASQEDATPVELTDPSVTTGGEEAFALGMAMISLDARGPQEISTGQTGSYVLRVENLSEEPIERLVIEVEMPAHLKLIEADLPSAGPANQFLVGQLEAQGNRELVLAVAAISQGTGSLTARALVAAEAEIEIRGVEPSIELKVFGPKRGELGMPMTYRVLVRNQGTTAIDAVRLETQISPGLQFVSQDETSGNLGWLEPGAEREVLYQLVADRPGNFKVAFSAIGDGAESFAEGTIQIGAADLQVQLLGPEVVSTGTESIYEVLVTNPSPQARRDVSLVVQLPQGMRVTALDRQVRQDTRGGKLILSLGAMESGETEALRFKAVPQRVGDRKLTATARGQGTQTAVAEHIVKIETRR